MSAADYDFPSCKSDHGHVYNAWIIVHFVVGFFLPFVIISEYFYLFVCDEYFFVANEMECFILKCYLIKVAN